MILDEVDLMELEDYINHLEATVGLKPETVLDVQKAINKRRSELKNFPKSDVIKSVCLLGYSFEGCTHTEPKHEACNYCDKFKQTVL